MTPGVKNIFELVRDLNKDEKDELIHLLKEDSTRLEDDRETPDKSARPIEEVVAEIVAKIPEEELDKLPTDFAKNLDHYLYGAEKVCT